MNMDKTFNFGNCDDLHLHFVKVLPAWGITVLGGLGGMPAPYCRETIFDTEVILAIQAFWRSQELFDMCGQASHYKSNHNIDTDIMLADSSNHQTVESSVWVQ